MSNTVAAAIARSKAALASFEAAKQSGNFAWIGAARADVLAARDAYLAAKSDNEMANAMLLTMASSAVHYDVNGITKTGGVTKAAGARALMKAAAGRRPGAVNFPVRRSV